METKKPPTRRAEAFKRYIGILVNEGQKNQKP